MSGWEYSTIEDCVQSVPATEKVQRKDFREAGRFPIVSQEAEFINGYWDDEGAVFRVERAVVVFGDHTKVLKFIDFDFVRGADGVKVLCPKPFLDAKFFYYALMASPVRSLGYARHYRLLAKHKIRYPRDIAEQKRIVAILDEAFEVIAKATANAERNLANARELYEEALSRLTEGNEQERQLASLKELTTKIGSGATPRGGRESYKESGISLIRSMNVHDRWFKEADLARIDDEQARQLDGVAVLEGDVLLNITGASVARCCIAPKDLLPARVNQHVAIIRPISEQLLPEYLCLLLTARHNKSKLLGIGEKAGATRQAITKADIEQFEVAFPPPAIQRSVIARLNHLESMVDRLSEIAEVKIKVMGELKQSILHKAFSGQLTGKEAIAA